MIRIKDYLYINAETTGMLNKHPENVCIHGLLLLYILCYLFMYFSNEAEYGVAMALYCTLILVVTVRLSDVHRVWANSSFKNVVATE